MTVLTTALACCPVSAQVSSLNNPAISGVLNGYYQSADRVLGNAKGFGLNETELTISASIDDLFYGKITTVLEMQEGETQVELEEAFIQTLAMPAGLGIRAGRFLSDIGYLNNQHPHADAFVERPAVYRAFLGSHYFDTGVRLNYLAPTELYWLIGSEAFNGDALRSGEESGERDYRTVGVYTAYTKLGGDIGESGSWQLGLNYLRNENGRAGLHKEHPAQEVAADEHGHNHDVAYTGKNLYGVDFVYKWAPQGNYKYRHLTLSGEYFHLSDFRPQDTHDAPEAEHADEGKDFAQGWYLSGVYQFSPNWSVGLRYGQVDTQLMHDEYFDAQKLKETELTLAWHQSHFSTVRLQYTRQQGTNFDGLNDGNIVTLQYIMTLGAHDAHQF
ncbi:MAG: hypothetical protein LPH21_16670 [Shewanella sp.]|nr:hypothetical protein [Shewanella sp.]MCF1459109.1 hypothetical protein [Shewanella sp.]